MVPDSVSSWRPEAGNASDHASAAVEAAAEDALHLVPERRS